MQDPETLPVDATFDVRQRLHDLVMWQEAAQTQANLIRAQAAAMDVNASKSEGRKAVKLSIWQQHQKQRYIRIPLELKPKVVETLGYQELRRHLVGQFALLSDEERLLWLENLSFVITSDLRRFTDLLSFYLSPYRYDQKNVLLEAPSGMGKTLFLEWWASGFTCQSEGLHDQVPMVFVDAPVGQSSRGLLRRILLACGIFYLKRDTEMDLLFKLVKSFQMLRVNGLVIDEIDHLQGPIVLRCLRNLEVSLEHHRIPIAGASCAPELWRQTNKELGGRWEVRFRLEPFTESRLQQLLSLINLILPFPEDSFVDLSLHKRTAQDFSAVLPVSREGYFIQAVTQGILREMMPLIIKASEVVIKQGLPCLNVDLLHQTWQHLHYQPGEASTLN